MSAERGVGSGLVGAYRLRRALGGEAVVACLSWAAWERRRRGQAANRYQ